MSCRGGTVSNIQQFATLPYASSQTEVPSSPIYHLGLNTQLPKYSTEIAGGTPGVPMNALAMDGLNGLSYLSRDGNLEATFLYLPRRDTVVPLNEPGHVEVRKGQMICIGISALGGRFNCRHSLVFIRSSFLFLSLESKS
ncbi:hypothetical protein L218DRAFT_369429 [Marasmius fiardii PR-910]|nr:hypothetical protein L218DRAFT_369429 [Marasmius fiardii PR-910]